MSSVVVESNGFEKVELPESGAYQARCYGLAMIGSHENKYYTDTLPSRKLILFFELSTELHVIDETKGEQPFSANMFFTVSLGKKSNLRPFITNWRGTSFTESELKGFDLKTLIGKPCLLTVEKSVNKNTEKEFLKIIGISSLPKGFVVPPLMNPKLFFDMHDPIKEDFFKFPPYVRKIIRESSEYISGNYKWIDEEENNVNIPSQSKPVSQKQQKREIEDAGTIENTEDVLPW